VVLDITLKVDSRSKLREKREVIQELYGSLPYVCIIRPRLVAERLGVRRTSDDHSREILIPHTQPFREAAAQLWYRDNPSI